MNFDLDRQDLIAIIGKQAAEIDRLLRACKDKTELLQAAYEQLSKRNHEIERQQADIDKFLAERQEWADEIEKLRTALSRMLLNYGAALPEGQKDQRSIVEARKLLGLDQKQ